MLPLSRRVIVASRRTTLGLASRATRYSSTSKYYKGLVQWDVRSVEDNEDRFVGTITLDDPDRYNALTVQMGKEFQALCRELTEDIITGKQQVDAIVVTGQGDDAFSAGGDLEWLKGLRFNSVHQNADLMLQFYNYFLCVRKLPVPVIAALNGPAMGAGAGLALACDLRTTVDREKILGLHFTKLGIHTGMGASHLLPLASGNVSGILNEILLTGTILSGRQCFETGLANRLESDAKKAAYNLASDVTAETHPVAVRLMVQTIRQRQDVGLEQALQREAMAQATCYARGDWGEGVTAIAEKRSPTFNPIIPSKK